MQPNRDIIRAPLAQMVKSIFVAVFHFVLSCAYTSKFVVIAVGYSSLFYSNNFSF